LLRQYNLRRTIFPLCLLVLSLSALTTLPAAKAQPLGWATLTSPTSNTLESVFCVSSTFCWGVGVFGIIIEWNGVSWATVSSPTGNTLNSVSCSSASDCWAVGVGGTAIHWDGSSWATVTTPTSKTLNSVWNGFWAVGVGGTILWYIGSPPSWHLYTPFSGATTTTFYSVTGYYIVGAGGTIFDHSLLGFSKGSSPTSNDLHSMSCLSPEECWAVGNVGTILQDTGPGCCAGPWVTVSSPTGNTLNSVSCVNASDCFAVGAGGTIIQWDGLSWGGVTSPTSSQLNSVSCDSSTDCWVVGDGGIIIHGAPAYSGTFSESGIPSGTTWGVTVGGTHYSTSSGTSIMVPGLVGTVSYTYDSPVAGSGGSYSCTSGCSGSVTLSSPSASATYTFSSSLLVTLTGPANGAKVLTGSTVTLKAKVTSGGTAVSGATVKMIVNGVTVCTKTSNKKGLVSCAYKVGTKTKVTYTWYATATKTGYTAGTSPTWTFHT